MFIFRSARGDNARHRLNKRHPARHVCVIGSLDPQTGALLPLMATTPSPETRVHARQLAMFKVPANGVTTSFTFVGTSDARASGARPVTPGCSVHLACGAHIVIDQVTGSVAATDSAAVTGYEAGPS